jgi:hypothetical protein
MALLAAVEKSRVRYDVLAAELEKVAEANKSSGNVAAAVAEAQETVDRFPANEDQGVLDRLGTDDAVDFRYADPVRRMVIAAAKARDAWKERNTDPAGAAARSEAAFRRARYQADRIVLAGKVGEVLSEQPVGGTIALANFYEGSPLSDAERKEAAEVVAEHPRIVPGVVDVDNGVVYRTASGLWTTALVFALPLFAALGGVVLLWILGHLDEWFSIEIDQLMSTRKLLEVYVLVTMGALLHLIVAARKTRVGQTATTFIPARAFDWAQIRALNLTPLVVPILVVTIGLRMTNLTVDGTEDWAVSILAGYSADSVAALVWGRLQKAVDVFGANVEQLK